MGTRRTVIPELTGLRGLAALYVLLYHGYVSWLHHGPAKTTSVWTMPYGWGWVGVDLFFVLSGFLLALPLMARPESIRAAGFWQHYLRSRWLRIAPPYYLSILVALAATGTLSYLWTSPGDIALHLAFFHNLDPVAYFSINPVYWTLANEFQFYLLLPLGVLLLARHDWRRWVVASFVLAILVHLVEFPQRPQDRLWSVSLVGFAPHFVLGILLARFHAQGVAPPIAHGKLALAGLGTLVGTLALLIPSGGIDLGDDTLVNALVLRPAIAVSIAAMLWGLASGPTALGRVLCTRPVQFLGTISFSLYLIHLPVQILIEPNVDLQRWDLTAYLAILTLASLAASSAFYAISERPSLLLRTWLLERARRAPSQPATAAVSPAAPASS